MLIIKESSLFVFDEAEIASEVINSKSVDRHHLREPTIHSGDTFLRIADPFTRTFELKKQSIPV